MAASETKGSVRAMQAALSALPASLRRRAFGLFAMSGAFALLDVIGVGLVFPLTAALLDQSSPEVGSRWLVELASWVRKEQLFVPAAIALLLVFLFKNAGQAVLIRAMARVSADAFAQVSGRILDRALHRPWVEHVREDSATTLRDVIDDAAALYRVALFNLLTSASHAFSLVLVVGLLLLFNWRALVAAGAISFLSAAVFLLFMSARVRRHATTRRDARRDMTRWVQNAFTSLKEARLYGAERYFQDGFERSARVMTDAAVVHEVTARLPRLVIETSAVGGVVLLLLLASRAGVQLDALAPMVATFGVALARLAPSIHGLVRSVVTVQARAPSARVLEHLPAETPVHARGARVFREALRLEDVSFRYPESDRDVLHGITLSLGRDEMLAIVGPSGAGKTTLADVLLGLLPPAAGRVLVDGQPLEPGAAWSSDLAYVPQTVVLLDDSVRRNVGFGREDEDIDDERVWQALGTSGLDARIKRLEGGLDARVGERGALLSGGERQRLAIARALYQRPALLVLDEATAALDPALEGELLGRLRREQDRPAVVLITHRHATAAGFARVVLLVDGCVAADGSWAELQGHPALGRDATPSP